MKIAALLSFYDEHPDDLARLVDSLPVAGITNLVALDGAYALYPDAKPASSHAEHITLRDRAKAAGIHLTLRIPSQPWQGNEIEKRTHLFDLATRATTPNTDWWLVIDGDEYIGCAPTDLHQLLTDSTFDAAEVLHDDQGHITHSPRLLRATPGLHCHANHYTYRTPDGRYLWGNARTTRLAPRTPAHELTIVHAPRSPQRRADAQTYYQRRDQAQIEHHHPLAIRA